MQTSSRRIGARQCAATYIRWISGFNLVFAFTFVLGAGLRGAGDTSTSLWLGVVNNVVNIALLYLFVYGGLGAPKPPYTKR